jgi:hypothetical protein
MVKSTLYNHYLIRICSLDVDMNNANEPSLYCRRLESLTFSPQKMLEMQTICSSISTGKEQRLKVHVCCSGRHSSFTEVLTVEHSVVV